MVAFSFLLRFIIILLAGVFQVGCLKGLIFFFLLFVPFLFHFLSVDLI